MDEVEQQHALECLQLAQKCYTNGEFEEVLQIIKDSGLDITRHKELSEIHKRCLCLKAELPLAAKVLAKAKDLSKDEHFENALAVINDCGLNLKTHVKLLEERVHCLKALGRDDEAAKDAKYLWAMGYEATREICQVIGEWLKKYKGPKKASEFYQTLINLQTISEDDRDFLIKLKKGIHNKNRIVDEEPKDANQPEEANQSEEANKPEEANQLDRSKKEKTEVSKTDQTKSKLEIKEKNKTEGEQKVAKVLSVTDQTKSKSEKKKTEGEPQVAKVLSESEQEIKDLSLKTKSKTVEEVEEETGTKGLSKETEKTKPKVLSESEQEIKDLSLKTKSKIVEEVEEEPGTKGLSKEIEKTESEKAQERVISVEFKIVIGNHVGRGLYEGQLISPTFGHPVSLVEATPSQILHINTLRNLSATSELLVTVECLIESSETFELLVTEPVVPIDSFFHEEMEKFQSSGFGENDKAEWWNHIKNHFTQIFRDVVHGFIYLWSLGYLCGDIKRLLYVGKRGQGKVLSLLDEKKAESLDIKNLIGKMQEILTLPFNDSVVDGQYSLPVELTSFLTFATPDKLKCIPFFWLVNYPFFWSKKERIDFVMGLKSNLKQDVWHESDLDIVLRYWTSISSQGQSWTGMIQGGEFKAVLDKPKKMNLKPYDDLQPVQIIRYLTACYNHINDRDNLLNQNSPYTPDDVEEHLRSFYPNIYIDLYEALYHYEIANIKSYRKSLRVKAFKDWSYLYFAK